VRNIILVFPIIFFEKPKGVILQALPVPQKQKGVILQTTKQKRALFYKPSGLLPL
jgi:hypothetical protein